MRKITFLWTVIPFITYVHSFSIQSALQRLQYDDNDDVDPSTIDRYMFNFGDSYTKVDFTFGGSKPSPQNPIGNPAFPGVTTSKGPNWVGELLTKLNTSVTVAYDLAYNGATVDRTIVAPYGDEVQCLVDQTTFWIENLQDGTPFCEWTPENSLFTFWFGINDIGMLYPSDFSSGFDLMKRVLEQYFTQVFRLMNAGARNLVFFTIPPINRSPQVLAHNSSSIAKELELIHFFNAVLTWFVDETKQQPAINATLIDTWSIFDAVLDNPHEYGFTDNATCQGGDEAKCPWSDDYHPGVTIQRLVAEAVKRNFTSEFPNAWF